MIVRVARQAALSQARSVTVAADAAETVDACRAHGVEAILTDAGHATGSDRLAEACATLGYGGAEIVVNVQGDEPLIDPSLIDACAAALDARADCVAATVAHPIGSDADFSNPNIVKVVVDAAGRALYFSRAPIPWPRDSFGTLPPAVPGAVDAPLRHVGLYAYRAGFLRRFPSLAAAPQEQIERLEQLRILWHGERIAVHVSSGEPAIGVDTAEDLARVRALFASAAPGSG